jgi:hypothetical protein
MSYQRDGRTPSHGDMRQSQRPYHQPSSQSSGDARSGAPNPSFHPSQRSQPSRPLRPDQVPVVLGRPRPAANRDAPGTRTIPQYRQDSGPPVQQYVHQNSITSWVNEVSPTYPSPDMPRPFAESHRDSTGSSVYSLPDFPVPQAPQVPQQVARPLYQPRRSSRRQTVNEGCTTRKALSLPVTRFPLASRGISPTNMICANTRSPRSRISMKTLTAASLNR